VNAMIHHLMLLYRLRFLLAGILMVTSFFLLASVLATIEPVSVHAQDTDSSAEVLTIDDPNVVAGSMAVAAAEAGRAANSAGLAIANSTLAAARTVNQGGKLIARGALVGATTVGRGVGRGLAAVGRAVGTGTVFVARIPGKAVGFVSNTSVVRSVTRPSDHVEVPIIDPNSPELLAALTALPPAKAKGTRAAAAQTDAGPVWPIHGEITTHFGVEHWPFQATHTGIDISDNKDSGVTPVKPFRPGRVTETVYSGYGLGNHVIVDHGNGVTSVYAHLDSISVKVGQQVSLKTRLGFEGTTGVSTGTHLHFEVRVNGQAADPRRFISGHP